IWASACRLAWGPSSAASSGRCWHGAFSSGGPLGGRAPAAEWEGRRMEPLILASASPRRRELLAMVGCPFEVVDPSVDEGMDGTGPGSADPGSLVEAVARRKAEAVAARFPGRLV